MEVFLVPSDVELINDFLNGNIQSFNRLAIKWQKNLFGFAYRYTGNEEEAKDICQKALIKAYKNLHNLKNSGSFSSWIYQITINLCKDEVKKRKNKNHIPYNENKMDDENSSVELISGDSPQIKSLEKKNIKEIIRFALNSIPEEQKIVIIMKEYQGLKFTEIAEILKCSVNTIKSRMYYGLNNMKEKLLKSNIGKEEILYEM
ncbi:RNA polymerase sigma factor [candidate division KSB1 bacterium]|nr:MAG: RNA polymerase sigma factor [candidate division KSB1 bacterium]